MQQSPGVPGALTELITLGRIPKKRAADVLVYFDHAGTSNGPTEAINGRLEHLCGSALGFRNLTNYIARSLLETGGFRPQLHPQTGLAPKRARQKEDFKKTETHRDRAGTWVVGTSPALHDGLLPPAQTDPFGAAAVRRAST